MKRFLQKLSIAVLALLTLSGSAVTADASHRHVHRMQRVRSTRVIKSQKEAQLITNQSLATLRSQLAVNSNIDYQLNLGGRTAYHLFDSMASYQQIQAAVRRANPRHQRQALHFLNQLMQGNEYSAHHITFSK